MGSDVATSTAAPTITHTPPPPAMGPLQLARWAWRQLTSMRVALILLFLLAVAAVPGSVFPQRRVDPLAVADFVEANPGTAPWLDRLSMFDVYGSPWFGAVYVLLFISLVGCVVPRSRHHLQAIRARPPAAPRRLERLPEHRRVTSDRDAQGVLDVAEAALRAKRYRVDRTADTLAAERGHLRETGNLVFHFSLLLILVGAALGGLVGYRGTAVVVEGETFANTVTQYDDLSPGRLYDPADLPPFSVALDDFEAVFEEERGSQRGIARDFTAVVTYRESPDDDERTTTIKVNEPLQLGGAKLHLLGHGYAPIFTVEDGDGDIVFQGPVPFLPQDKNFTSAGVVKVPDAVPEQLGFQGFFLPTAIIDTELGPTSAFPGALNPAVVLLAWRGDLGIDAGIPQSVYQLDLDNMDKVTDDGQPVSQILGAGDILELPDGLGRITYDGYVTWINLQVSDNPGLPVLLTGSVLAMVSVSLSLFVRRRRLWFRVAADAGAGTVVDVAGLDRAHGGDLADELDALVRRLGEVGSATSTMEGSPVPR